MEGGSKGRGERQRKKERRGVSNKTENEKKIDVSDSYKSFFLFFSSGLLYGEYLGEDRGKMKISEEESD